jgi:hypothetical protein
VDSERLKEWRTFSTRNDLATGLAAPGKGTEILKVLAGGRGSQAEPEGSGRLTLDELAREGARRMIAAALAVEVEEYLARHREERDVDGRALVVRNGRSQARRLTVGAGTMDIEAPRINDERVIDGERQRFTSKILPPYLRRSPKVTEVLPLLYLHGLSTGDFREALPTLLGDDAAGLSPSAVTGYSVPGRRSTVAGAHARSRTATTFTSGPTACTSTFGSTTIVWPRSCSSARGPTATRN